MAFMSVDSLKANLTNPQRTFNWELLIPVPIGGGDSNLFTIRAQSSQVPSRENSPINVPFKQTAGAVFAGKLTYTHTWECSFVEGEDHKIYDAIHDWQEDIVGENTGIGLGDPLYKTDAYITQLTTAGGNSLRLKLKGIWPQNIAVLPLSYENNTVAIYTVTFAFDSFEKAD